MCPRPYSPVPPLSDACLTRAGALALLLLALGCGQAPVPPTSAPQPPATPSTYRVYPSLGFGSQQIEVNCAAFSSDGKFVLTGYKSFRGDPYVKNEYGLTLWDVATGKPLRTWGGHWGKGRVEYVTFLPGDKTVITASDAAIKLWDIPSCKEVRSLDKILASVKEATGIAVSPNGKLLVVQGQERDGGYGIRLWDIATETMIRPLIESGPGIIHAMTFSPDGRLLVTANMNIGSREMEVWDVATGKVLRRLPVFGSERWGASFSPNGEQLLTHRDMHLVLWDVDTWKGAEEFGTKDHWVRAAFFTEGGRSIATSGDGAIVKLWDTASGQEVWTVPERTQLWAVSANGTLAFTGIGCNDVARQEMKLVVWDLANRNEKIKFDTGPLRP